MSSLLLTYQTLTALINQDYGHIIDKQYLNDVSDLFHTMIEYKWEKET